MAQENRKDSKKKSFFKPISNLFKRSAPSVSSGGGQEHPGKVTPSQSTTSLPLASSTDSPLAGTPLNPPTVIAPEDDGGLSASYRLRELVPSSPAPDLHELRPMKGSVQAAPAAQHSGHANSPTGVQGSLQSANQDAKSKSSLKDNLKLTGRALQTVLTKAVDIVDTDPVKVALGLVKAVIEIKNAVKDNTDAIAQQITSTGGHLEVVANTLGDWKPDNQEEIAWINHFKATLEGELEKLNELNNESKFRKFLDHEDEQARIKNIFVRINEARVQFELALGIRVFETVYEVDKAVKRQLLNDLKPSDIAHHDYILEGDNAQLLRRQVCTPGTRVRIVEDIVMWANDTILDSPNVYWLFGHAGSGKSTIAYTIARRLEFAGDSTDTIILGGNFFCSRHFTETRLSKYIIRTIVYQLALKCKPFSDALLRSWKPEVITQNHRSQLDALLFRPWQESIAARDDSVDTPIPPHYLIVIDALDEIDGTGGPEFLRALVDAINKINNAGLHGLKFFVTSRSDESLVTYVESLKEKRHYHLQDVQEEEARADVAMYLHASLPHFIGHPQMAQLEEYAAGQFIYAATVVKYVQRYNPAEHPKQLKKLFPTDSKIGDIDDLLNRIQNFDKTKHSGSTVN